MNQCPQCEGHGWIGFSVNPIHLECDLCKGTGSIDAQTTLNRATGQAYKAARIARRETLIGYSNRMHLDPETVSKAERGVIDPTTILK
jgi:RecJ-like exonuclease